MKKQVDHHKKKSAILEKNLLVHENRSEKIAEHVEKVKELEEKVRAHQKNSRSRGKINTHLKNELDKEKRKSKELTKLLRKHQKENMKFKKEKRNKSWSYCEMGLRFQRKCSTWIKFFERKNESD